MDTVLQLIGQIVIMFLLAGIGYILFRTGKISLEGSKTIGNILIYIVLPTVIIKGFLVERTPERMLGLAVSAGLAAGALLICIVISRLLFRKDTIASFAASFSNPGFFGIPLIIAILGNDSVFYIAAYVGFLNLLQFTYGKVLITGDKKSMSAKQVLKAPFLTAIIIGLILQQDPQAQIVLHGLSMGASTALLYCGRENVPDNIKAVISDCAYTDAYSMFQEKIGSWFHLPAFPVVDSAELMIRLRAGYDLKETSPLKAVSSSMVPTLFIHGKEDRMIPVSMCRELYDAAACEKEIMVVEGAGHAQAADKDPAHYFEEVERFLREKAGI